MENLEKYYDILENTSIENMTEEERKMLENELGNLDSFMQLDDKIMNSVNTLTEAPSARVKQNLDNAFEARFGNNAKPKHNGIISIAAFQKSSPLKIMATAASVTLILFLSVQVGLKPVNHQAGSSTPYLADSSNNPMMDSSYMPSDTIFMAR